MESLPNYPMLEFHPNTLEAVRKEFNLDKPGRIQEAIDLIEDWIQKQNHFTKKDFSRDYLERTLITTKGLVERAKLRLDKLCTFKTLMPNFYENVSSVPDISKFVYHGHIPKMTKDHYRIYFQKMRSDQVDSSTIFDYYKFTVIASEYMKSHDYCKGFLLILDFADINLVNLIPRVNPIDLRQALTLLMEGYGLRIKGIHIITPSKMVDALIGLFKQVLSEKIVHRIHTHKTVESLYQHVEKDLLPEEYGGKSQSLKTINDEWYKIFSSTAHMSYIREMNNAKTDESCRQVDKFNENYVGMPGSFRTLTVD